jgi:hypothetical protein
MNGNHTDNQAATTLHIKFEDLSPAGEELSTDEIDLVAGGVGSDIPSRGCPHTKPINDDFTCLGGWLD